jgi:endonuclease-3
MAATARAKTADRHAIIKKLLPLIKKQCKVSVPKLDRPIMETMLYAVCLENASVEEADRTYARLFQVFPDLNEARVSSITEIEPVFEHSDDRDWRAFRIRSVLQYVFEKSFNFELESLRKKTLDLASKQLAKIRHLTPFVRSFTLQQAIGAHLLPLDDASTRLLIWLGFAAPGHSGEDLGESLKAIVRKAEAQQFCFSLRALATDRKWSPAFQSEPPADGGYDLSTAIERLNDLFKHGPVKAKPKPASSNDKPKGAASRKKPAAKAASHSKPAKKAHKAAKG